MKKDSIMTKQPLSTFAAKTGQRWKSCFQTSLLPRFTCSMQRPRRRMASSFYSLTTMAQPSTSWFYPIATTKPSSWRSTTNRWRSTQTSSALRRHRRTISVSLSTLREKRNTCRLKFFQKCGQYSRALKRFLLCPNTEENMAIETGQRGVASRVASSERKIPLKLQLNLPEICPQGFPRGGVEENPTGWIKKI
ncbi:uncharacterized protein LOC109195119 isoform X2 [Oreochromis niloticus]|nr:uncharacterized protein LOC109195119 isoform X2 [Oreochromis niloticus]XP_019202168.1 uncharacterized protein LOC109195119 isoform X2 [Oreochromis niloticus]